MSTNLSVPFIQLQGYSDAEVVLNKILLKKIISDYKKYVDEISTLTNVPKMFIYNMIFIESNGKSNAYSGGTYGLMQLFPTSAGDVLTMEKNKGRLTEPERLKLVELLGEKKVNNYTSRAHLGVVPNAANTITGTDLLKPEVNIMFGALYLGLLIDKYTYPDEGLRFDKVVIGYNAGYFTSIPSGDVNSVYSWAVKNYKYTPQYITKSGGKNGILSYFNDTDISSLI